MTVHAATQYLLYLLRAKGRHGTHSPFVYELVEKVIQALVQPGEPAGKYERVLARIRQYYQCNVDELAGAPGQWGNLLHMQANVLRAGDIIFVRGIHQTAAHTRAWQQLCNDPAIKMSIDFYGIGLLIWRQEFKVRQGFVLKC